MTTEQQAQIILTAVWRGIPLDYKRQYRNIWEQFENRIRSAASGCSRVNKFISLLCLRLRANMGRNAGERAIALEAVKQATASAEAERALLKHLRVNTTLAVLEVRVAIQEQRDEWQAAHPDGEPEEFHPNSEEFQQAMEEAE